MRITEDAVNEAVRFTKAARQQLESNYNYMRSGTTPYLAEWHDANVERFMEVLELFDSYIKTTSSTMEEIEQKLLHYIAFIQQYNS